MMCLELNLNMALNTYVSLIKKNERKALRKNGTKFDQVDNQDSLTTAADYHWANLENTDMWKYKSNVWRKAHLSLAYYIQSENNTIHNRIINFIYDVRTEHHSL